MRTMSLLPTLFVFLSLSGAYLSADVIDGTEIVLAFMIHRHGDRTPVEKTADYFEDREAIRSSVEPYGYGQLTNIGKQRSYELGKYLRSRYDDLLGTKYNASRVYLRSTDSTRTKMSCLAAMAAVYPPSERAWNPYLNWAPTPYTTTPAKYDPNLALLNCPKFIAAYYGKFMSYPPSMEKYAELFEKLAALGYDIKSFPVTAYALYDAFVAASNLGYELSPELKELMPELTEVAGEAIDIAFGDEEYLAIQAGVLLKTFFDVADDVIAGTESRRIWIYSAHDYNVYSLYAISRAHPRPGVPKYSSLFSLELRRITGTGQYVVVPVYVSSPGEKETYPQIKGCDGVLCEFEQYRVLSTPYFLNETEYRNECNFDENAEIDTSSID